MARLTSCSKLPGSSETSLLISDNRTRRCSERHGVSTFPEPAAFANVPTHDRQSRLSHCRHRSRCLSRREHEDTISTLVREARGHRLHAANALVVSSDGSIWFSNPLDGLLNDDEGSLQIAKPSPALDRLDPESGTAEAVASDCDGPTDWPSPPTRDCATVPNRARPASRSRASPSATAG